MLKLREVMTILLAILPMVILIAIVEWVLLKHPQLLSTIMLGLAGIMLICILVWAIVNHIYNGKVE